MVVPNPALLRQYYYAMSMQPVQVVGGQLFVWGSRPLPNSLATACAYIMSLTTGTVIPGPCLHSFGEGESADALDVRYGTYSPTSTVVEVVRVRAGSRLVPAPFRPGVTRALLPGVCCTCGPAQCCPPMVSA